MSYNRVTVTYKWQDSNGDAAEGRYVWHTSNPIVDTVNDVGLDEPPIIGELDATGSMSVSLLAQDNAGLSDFNWVLSVYIGGEYPLPVAYEVLFSNGATQKLDDLPKA